MTSEHPEHSQTGDALPENSVPHQSRPDDSPHSTPDATPEAVPSAIPDNPSAGGPGRLRLVLAVVISVVAIAAIAILARVVGEEPPADPNAAVAVSVVFQPGSTTQACADLDAALPATLAELPRRALIAEEPGVAAWGAGPVVYRCGVEDPASLVCSSALTTVNGVSWLQISDFGLTTYYAVDRTVRIALTLPDGSGSGPIQALSDVVDDTLPVREPCLDGVLQPTDSAG